MMKDLRICSNLPLLQLQNRLLNSWERFFQLISDLSFLSVVGATLSHHRYNFSALSNRILSMISFALLTERYPSSIFSVRTLHSEKRNARSEP